MSGHPKNSPLEDTKAKRKHGLILHRSRLGTKHGQEVLTLSSCNPQPFSLRHHASISWSSSNPEIASVDGGAVTGKAGGNFTNTSSSGEETATCQVKVEGDPWVNPNPDSFKLSKTDFTLKPSESTWQMKIKRNDGSWEILGSADGVVWASNNPNVCNISDTGVVTRTGKGTTQITATVDGVTLDCTVRMS